MNREYQSLSRRVFCCVGYLLLSLKKGYHCDFSFDFTGMSDNQSQSSESAEPYLNYSRLQDDIEKVSLYFVLYDCIASRI